MCRVKNTINDDKFKDKIDASKKQEIEDKVADIIKFIEDNPNASKEEYEAKQKELEAIANPAMAELYKDAGGAPGAEGEFS